MEGKKILSDYFSGLIAGFAAEAKAMADINHKLTNGTLKEVLLSRLLQRFLPSYLAIGNGIIINNNSCQSNQTDLIVYDTRIMPPFVGAGSLNIFPIECVVATVEVKSLLDSKELLETNQKATFLIDTVHAKNDWRKAGGWDSIAPLCAIFGINGTDINQIENLSQTETTWLDQNVRSLRSICTVGKLSWLKRMNGHRDEWIYGETDSQYREVRRFIATLVDNMRTRANLNYSRYENVGHCDWLGLYLRDQ